MDRRKGNRGLTLLGAFLVTAFFAACQDLGPTGVPAGLDVQAAKGGNGRGGGPGGDPPPPPPMIAVAGGVVTTGAQAGGYNVKKKNVAIGSGPEGCADGEGDAHDQCFDSTLNYAADIVGGQSACTPDPADLSPPVQDALYAEFTDAEQKRWLFQGDIHTGQWTADFRTFWWEDDSMWGADQRFVILHFNQSASSPAQDVFELSGGDVTIVAEGQNAQLHCLYGGGLTITVTP